MQDIAKVSEKWDKNDGISTTYSRAGPKGKVRHTNLIGRKTNPLVKQNVYDVQVYKIKEVRDKTSKIRQIPQL